MRWDGTQTHQPLCKYKQNLLRLKPILNPRLSLPALCSHPLHLRLSSLICRSNFLVSIPLFCETGFIGKHMQNCFQPKKTQQSSSQEPMDVSDLLGHSRAKSLCSSVRSQQHCLGVSSRFSLEEIQWQAGETPCSKIMSMFRYKQNIIQ